MHLGHQLPHWGPPLSELPVKLLCNSLLVKRCNLCASEFCIRVHELINGIVGVVVSHVAYKLKLGSTITEVGLGSKSRDRNSSL